MAQKTVVTLTDDLDEHQGRSGVEANTTITFAINGNEREIDLSEVNASQFYSQNQPFLDASRPAQGKKGGRRSSNNGTSQTGGSAPKPGTDRELNKAIREFWTAEYAQNNDLPVPSERGRIPKEITKLYNEKHGDTATPPVSNEGAVQPQSPDPTMISGSNDGAVEQAPVALPVEENVSSPESNGDTSGLTWDAEDGIWRDQGGFELSDEELSERGLA